MASEIAFVLYTGAASNAPVISVLTRPFFLSPNRDIIRSNKAPFGGREKGAVKTEITGAFEVAPVYTLFIHHLREICMTPCHAILFDIDDTLVDFKKSETVSLTKCYEHFFTNWVNFEQFHSDYSRINLSLWKLVEENKMSPSILGKERFKQVAEHYGMSDSLEISQYYHEQLIQNSSWINGAPELLSALKEKSIKLGFVTNGFSHLQKSKYNKLKLAQYSDILVISEEIGFSKPHPHIFFHALNLTNTEIKHTLMVGDSLSSDGEGARGVGLPFCWYNPKKIQHNLEWEPHFIISDLMSLLDIMV